MALSPGQVAESTQVPSAPTGKDIREGAGCMREEDALFHCGHI